MGATCRICDEPATRTVGAYAFCERHFERSTHARRGARDADIASIVLLVVFVLVVYAVDALVRPELGDIALIVVGIVLALVPAAVWLAFFYRQDRLEPEPRTMVIGEFLLGLLVATAVAIPLLEGMFDVGTWLSASPLVHLAGGILVVGTVQEGLKYLTLRLSVYDSREFDERTDGIIYGTAVGLGFATALNIAFVVDSGGVDLGTGAIRIVLTSLAHASFGGVIGYFLGRQKFERRPIWWMPAGVALAATLNGVFFFLRSTVARGTIEDPVGAIAPWVGLALAAILTGATTVALVAGLLLRMNVEGGVERVGQGGLEVAVPRGWVLLPAAGDRLLTAYDPLDPDLRYGVSAVDAAAGTAMSPEDAAARRLQDRGQLLSGFSIISEGPGSLGDVATYDVAYAFVDQVPGGATTTIEAVEHYFADGALFAEDRVVVVALEAPPDAIENARPAFERFAQDIANRSGATASTPVVPSASDARIASLDGSLGPRRASPAATADLIKGTVQVFLTATVGGREQAVGWGSGTIISSDGLILTNAHVAMPSAAGLGVYEADPTPAVDPEDLVVAIVTAEDEPAVPTYRASVIAADGYLDVAVIRIDRNLDGRRISPSSLDLPTVPIGDSESIHVGDDVTVVGFPGIGGNTISLSSGRASGFLGDGRIGPRAWIKTDAVVSQGNSGGLAANDAGELIGVPTRGPSDTGGYSLLRPIALLSGVLEAGRAGRRSVDSRYLVPSTGRERLSLDTWTDSLDACPATTRLSSYPSRTRQIVAGMDHTGFASGEDVVSQWRLDGEVVYRSGRMLSPGSEQGGCLFDSIYHDRGLPDGSYVIEVFAGPRLKPVLSAQTTVGAAAQAGSATLSGRIIDADSGQPIARAVIFMLTPGTDPVAWQTSPSDAQVAAYAQTVSDGTFTVMGLQAGTAYPALAVADGYVAANGTIGPLGDGGNELVSPISLTRAST